MSTIKSSAENLTLNADGANNDVIIQSNGSTKVTVDGATGGVGIGVTPETWQSTYKMVDVNASASFGGHSSYFTYMGNNWYVDASGNHKYKNTSFATRYYQDSSGKHHFQTAPSGSADAAVSFATAMTINNDSTCIIGTVSPSFSDAKLALTSTGAPVFLEIKAGTTGTFGPVKFQNPNGTAGSISMYASSVGYNTSSDYRLKENVDYTWDATTRLKQLKPARFNFIVDDTNTLVDGFIAHEVSSVVPEAISGTKDAMMDEEYEVTPAVMDGDTVVTEAVMGTRSVPDMQGIDQSKLVPLLVKTIQELEARITALET